MTRRFSLIGGLLAILILAAGCTQSPLGPELDNTPAVEATFNNGRSGDNIKKGKKTEDETTDDGSTELDDGFTTQGTHAGAVH